MSSYWRLTFSLQQIVVKALDCTAVSLFKRHIGLWLEHCSHLGARLAEEERRKKKKNRKMTKLDFHHFQVRHFNNVFEQS